MYPTVRTKLIVVFFIVLTIPLLILGFSTYIQVANSLKEEMRVTATKDMNQIDYFIAMMFKDMIEDCHQLATNPNVLQADETVLTFFDKKTDTFPEYKVSSDKLDARIFAEFERYAKSHPDVAYVYMGLETGGYIQWPREIEKAGYDPRKRQWYKQSIKNPNKVVLSEPYESFLEDNFVVSTTSAIKDRQGKVIGVVGTDVNLVQFSKVVEEFNKANMSYIFICTQEGLIVTHPNEEMLFQNISAIGVKDGNIEKGNDSQTGFSDYSRLLEEPEGFLETVLDGKSVFIYFQTSKATGWKMATVVVKEAFWGKVQHIGIIISSVIVILMLFALWGIPLITRFLTRPLEEVVCHLETIAEGNFSGKLSESILKREDEIGKVAQAVDLVQGSRNQAEQLLKSSNEELSVLYHKLANSEVELRTQLAELRDKQQELEVSEERYRLATEGVNDAIWDWDIPADNIVASKRWMEKLGWSNEELSRFLLSWKEIVHHEDEPKRFNALQDHLDGKTSEYLCEYRVQSKSGEYLWIRNRGKALFDKNGKAVRMAGSFTDITVEKMDKLQIQHMAYYDSLTNIPNRASIIKKLSLEMSNQEASGAILFIDLDNFKLVNDSFGYEYGDQLLAQVAKKIRDIAGGNFVARLGGDEFIMMVMGITEESIIEGLAERITSTIDQPFSMDSDSFLVTASIGIALYPKDGNQPDQLMRSANLALHRAKKEGKRCYRWFQREFEYEMLEKLHIEYGLREAIGNGELVLHYQPIIELKSGKIVGLEALIRWHSPAYGILFPGKFMSIAEESGLIVDIGPWVMGAACRFGKRLQDAGHDGVCIAVNISVKELLHNDFVQNVTMILNDTGFLPSCLELEIVESLLIEKFEVAIPKINSLRAMGVKVNLDDFGTGYSSLSYLKELPIDTLKIDRSFVSGAMTEDAHAAIIEAIITLSHRLQIEVVAEGVEAESERSFLSKIKCDKIQGNLISEPLPEEEIWERFLNI